MATFLEARCPGEEVTDRARAQPQLRQKPHSRTGCDQVGEILYYVLVGAASLPYVNAPEVRLLTGRNPSSPEWITAHADGLVAILLPGLSAVAD